MDNFYIQQGYQIPEAQNNYHNGFEKTQDVNQNQIKYGDYWSLVNMLTQQISPITRKQILEKLMEMNNQLFMGQQTNIQMDLSRAGALNSRKKDVTELQHPAMDPRQFKGNNPVPVNFGNDYSVSQNPYTMNPRDFNQLSQTQVSNYHDVLKNRQINNNSFLQNKKDYGSNDLDIDDLINEIAHDEDSGSDNDLEEKLSRIKHLQSKIITERRRRKKEK